MIRRAVILFTLIAGLLAATGGLADTATPSRSTYAKLIDVQELWSKDKYDEAFAVLEELANKTRDSTSHTLRFSRIATNSRARHWRKRSRRTVSRRSLRQA